MYYLDDCGGGDLSWPDADPRRARAAEKNPENAAATGDKRAASS